VSATLPEEIPHRFPFRLIERVEAGPGSNFAILLTTADGFLTATQPWPVTLVAEALAQAILLVHPPMVPGSLRLVGLDRVSMLEKVAAGDRLEVEVSELGAFGGLRRFSCRALRLGAIAAAAEVTVAG
jgi:3-hydroxymyristoyl/3-hydroxydecanoyl-(acyl carrier protein) dehydratase